jgi:glycosyltransferase involved in cell wall biosynthesis
MGHDDKTTGGQTPRKDKPTIAQVCPRYHPYQGGIETVVREISERLARDGYQVEVLTTDPSDSLPKTELINGVTVRRFWSVAPSDAYYFSPALRRYLRKNSSPYDVIHAHGYHAFPALIAYQARTRGRFVFSPHYHESGHTLLRSMLHVPYSRIARRMVSGADQIVCVSNYERRLLERNFSVDDSKLTVIPNGVNLEEFNPKRTSDSHKTVLYVGRLEKYKGLEYLLQALPRLDRQVRLEVVGQGPYIQPLVQLAKRLRVEDRVEFFGVLSRPQLLERYSEADVFVSLSTHEAFGITVAEALASGTPCIVARASGLQEFIDGRNCFGIEVPIDTEALAELIKKVMLVRISPLRLSTWDDVVDRLVGVYNSAVETRSVRERWPN